MKKTKDKRSIWLVTTSGAPSGFVWAKTEAEALSFGIGDAAARTEWRRVPDMLRHDFSDPALAGTYDATTEKIGSAGMEWSIKDIGKARANEDEERDAPDGIVKDAVKLNAAKTVLGITKGV